jgi:hypothetical protein
MHTETQRGSILLCQFDVLVGALRRVVLLRTSFNCQHIMVLCV